jgi:hypothetical protein
MEENKESQVTLEKEKTQTTEATQNILFGTMNISQALFVLIASANYSQAKGGFNLLESETLSAAIRAIRKTSEKNESQDKN